MNDAFLVERIKRLGGQEEMHGFYERRDHSADEMRVFHDPQLWCVDHQMGARNFGETDGHPVFLEIPTIAIYFDPIIARARTPDPIAMVEIENGFFKADVDLMDVRWGSVGPGVDNGRQQTSQLLVVGRCIAFDQLDPMKEHHPWGRMIGLPDTWGRHEHVSGHSQLPTIGPDGHRQRQKMRRVRVAHLVARATCRVKRPSPIAFGINSVISFEI
jgi:hypothetical protein